MKDNLWKNTGKDMLDKPNGSKYWMEYLRLITPFMLLILNFIGVMLFKKIDSIDTKLFNHLTNEEIHYPRAFVASKSEFEMYVKMRDKQWSMLYDNLTQIQEALKDIRKNIR